MTTNTKTLMQSNTLAALIIEATKYVTPKWQTLASKALEWAKQEGYDVECSALDLASLAACIKMTAQPERLDASMKASFLEYMGVKKSPPLPTQAGVPVTIGDHKGVLGFARSNDFFSTGDPFPLPSIIWDGEPHPSVPKVNPNFYEAPTVARVLVSLAMGSRTWCYGHTGTGKTATIREIAARLGLPLTRINFDSEMTRADLVGKTELLNDNGTTVSRFVEGILPKALPHPGIILLDELDFIRPDLAYVMQAVLEGDELVLTGDGGRRVPVHPQCWIVACANTAGQGDDVGLYRGAREQSAAFLNRFQSFIPFEYMNWMAETELLVKDTGIDKDMAEKLALYMKEHREAFERREVMTPISYRQARAAADRTAFCALSFGESHSDWLGIAMQSAIFNALPNHEQIKMEGIAQRLNIGWRD